MFQACGPVSFEIYADNSDTPLTDIYNTAWAEITLSSDGVYRLTVDTLLDLDLIDNETFKDITLIVKSTITNYPSQVNYDSIVVTITETTCDC